MKKEEVRQVYSKEVLLSCESMTYGKRKFTLPQKNRLLENFYRNNKNKQLVGPIADASAEGYDAVLLRRSEMDSLVNCSAHVLVKTEKGEIVSKFINYDFCSARNYPGNHLVIIESKTGIGIYEDTNKNEKEPVFKEYERKLEKVEIYKFIHQMAQIFLCVVDLVIMTFAFEFVKNQGWYIKLPVCFISSLLYPLMLKGLKKHYIKKFSEEIFENIFSQIGITFYILLLIVVMCYSFHNNPNW